jgi:uncharacterized protein with HEPN domain
MIEAIDRALSYVTPFASAAAFAQDQQALDAVIRTVEILGEAANRISRHDPDFVTAHPEMPWLPMRTMRNKMIHDYFTVDPLIVWQTVKTDLPPLRALIVTLLNT